MNGNHLWFCGICDKTITANTKSKHLSSKTHIHKENCVFVVKEVENF